MMTNQSPSAEHWFGTDKLASEMFASTWYRPKNSLSSGIRSVCIAAIVGIIWRSVLVYLGGKVDDYMMAVADILSGVPYLLVVILLMVVMKPGLWTMIIAMTITGWINMARIVRGEVMRLKNEEYVLAAK